MRKREERREYTTFKGGCHLSNLPRSFSPLCFYPSCGQAVPPHHLPHSTPSPWCHSQPARSLSHAYCLSVFLHHFRVNCQICPWTCINFETLCFIHCFALTCVSASDTLLNLVIRPALVTSSLRMCNFKSSITYSFFFLSLRKKRNQTLYSNALLAMSGCVSTEFI